jgi:S1-C subfamily serine protease
MGCNSKTAWLAAAVLVLPVLAQPPARAFSPDVLASVVSVLPEWPDAASRPEEPEGSAVAVLAGGYLATNVHVLGRAKRLRVRLHDGRLMDAEIIGRDGPTDIALIRVGLDLPVPEAGPEPALADPVCAVGNAFGLDLSVTCGVVSAVHRTGTGFNPVEDFIQTDAAINPGGSGGALVDARGRLVGMVSAIFTKQSDANIGVNFAASLRLVMRVVTDLKELGRVRRGKSGLRVENLADAERVKLTGARIIRVTPGGAAEQAGLVAGDIVTAIDDRRIVKASDVTGAMYLHRPGDPARVRVLRDGAAHTFTLVPTP